jgi:hypothetical protein
LTTTKVTPEEDVELTLIERDANDVLRALLGTNGHPDVGALAYPTMPLVGLVTEESFGYLSRLSQRSGLGAPAAALFARFARAVTKTRASIKLFDDTDGRADGLVELLAVAHAKSVESFHAPHRGLIRSLIRPFQPDLGVFFVDQNVVATSHAVLPAMGISLEELKSFSPKDFSELGKRMFNFSKEVGAYMRQLADAFEPLGKHIQLHPEPLKIGDLRVTHNDFVGAKVYRAALDRFRPSEERFAGAVIMSLANINAALHVLPRLLGTESNLLLRIQVLTAYHASNALEASVPHIMAALPPFTEAERTVLRSRELRNICAHYGLRRAAKSAIGATDPFGAAIQTLTSASRSDVSALFIQWLNAGSSALTPHFSKPSLAPARALLGSHS